MSAEGEFSGSYRNNGIQGNTSIYTTLFGPEFYPFRHRKITPFGHFLWGQGFYRVHFPPFGGFPSQTDLDWHSAWEAGGGVDYAHSKRWEIRVIQVDYGQTKFFGRTENNYRATIGIIYNFGRK